MARRRRRRWLVIFARAPRLCQVKRRLAAGIGPLAALRFHRETTRAIVRRLGDPRWTTIVAVTPDRAATPRGRRWLGRAPDLRGQGAGDLGQRMARPLRGLPPGPVVIVGSDIPDIRPRHIAAAFRALGSHDAVFGPADDGGYWLIGLKRTRRPGRLFANVAWSTHTALADTIRGLPPGSAIARIETLADIDTAADLKRWRARQRDRVR